MSGKVDDLTGCTTLTRRYHAKAFVNSAMLSVTYDWRPKRSALGTHNNQLPRASGRTNRSSPVLHYCKGKLDVSLGFVWNLRGTDCLAYSMSPFSGGGLGTLLSKESVKSRNKICATRFTVAPPCYMSCVVPS